MRADLSIPAPRRAGRSLLPAHRRADRSLRSHPSRCGQISPFRRRDVRADPSFLLIDVPTDLSVHTPRGAGRSLHSGAATEADPSIPGSSTFLQIPPFTHVAGTWASAGTVGHGAGRRAAAIIGRRRGGVMFGRGEWLQRKSAQFFFAKSRNTKVETPFRNG